MKFTSSYNWILYIWQTVNTFSFKSGSTSVKVLCFVHFNLHMFFKRKLQCKSIECLNLISLRIFSKDSWFGDFCFQQQLDTLQVINLLKYKKQVLMCWPGQYSQWSLQTSRAESQGCVKLLQNWLCAALHPLLGTVSCLNTFSLF